MLYLFFDLVLATSLSVPLCFARDFVLQKPFDLEVRLIRYQDFKGAEDLNADMEKLLKKWSINRDKLEAITRKLWSEGFRPASHSSSDNVGSGFDTSDSTQP